MHNQSMRIRQRLDSLLAHADFPTVVAIVEKLTAQGHQAVLAGGAVRDALLGVVPKDIDVATSAPPEVVEATFPQTLAVGKAFGTIVVIEGNRGFEVTTFRTDGGYVDGRHPESVTFSSIQEDAKRRDFTVNALFYEPATQDVLDYVGGIRDLKSRVLQTVGEANERFAEDHLRMLRAIRFIAQLGFDLEEKTLAAIQARAGDILKVSSERVFNEMKRFLESNHLIRGLKVFKLSGLDTHVWPELATLDLRRLENFPAFLNWENAFAALSLLSGGADPEPRLRAWKVSRESLRRIQTQIQGYRILADEKSTRAARARVLGGEVFAESLQLAENLARGKEARQRIADAVAEFLLLTGKTGELPNPLVNGQDLLSQGIEPGERMGKILKEIFEMQLEGKISSKTQAFEEIRNLKSKV